MSSKIQKPQQYRRGPRQNMKVATPTTSPVPVQIQTPNPANSPRHLPQRDLTRELVQDHKLDELSVKVQDTHNEMLDSANQMWTVPTFQVKKMKSGEDLISIGKNRSRFAGQVMFPPTIQTLSRADGSTFVIAKFLLKIWNSTRQTGEDNCTHLIPIHNATIQIEAYDEVAQHVTNIQEGDYVEAYGNLRVSSQEKEIGGGAKKIYYTSLTCKTLTKFILNNNTPQTYNGDGMDDF
jgi:hypothetical protein